MGVKAEQECLELGLQHLEDKNFDEARQIFLKVLEVNPSHDAVQHIVGTIYSTQGKMHKARMHLERALDLNPNNDWTHFEIGKIDLQNGKFDKAIEGFRRALSINPSNDVACLQLGIAYKHQGKPKDSRTHIGRAVRLNPLNEEAIFELGMLQFEEKEYKEAFNTFLTAQALNPSNDAALSKLGALCRIVGKRNLARKALENAAKLNPKNEEASFELGVIAFEEENYSEACEKFQKAVQINPSNYNAQHCLGVSCRLQGKMEKAKRALNASIRLNSAYDLPHFQKGYISYQEGDFLESIRSFLTALAINPGNGNAFHYFKHVFSLLKKDNEMVRAKEFVNHSLQRMDIESLNSEGGISPKLLLHLAEIRSTVGEFEAAQELIDKALDISERESRPMPIWRIVYLVTLRCNLRCSHCWFYNDADPAIFKEPELSTSQVLNLFDQSEILKRANVCISGGEIFSRNDMVEILISIAEKGARYHFFTNGCFPKKLDQVLSSEKVRAAVSHVLLSLDGDREAHDSIRGKGVFDKLEESIRVIRSHGVEFELNTALQEQNIRKVEEIERLGQEWGARRHNFEYVSGENNCSKADVGSSKGKAYVGMTSFEKNTEQSKFTGFGCMAGIAKCQIRPSGIVEACGASQLLTPFILGDLRNFDLNFEKLWISEEAMRTRKIIKSCVGCASYCER